MKKEGLVLLKGKKILTTSEIIAKNTDNEHDSVMKLITEHEDELKQFGIIRFEIGKIPPKDWKNSKRGRPKKIAYLNREQTMLLIMCMKNNDKVMKFKIEITKEFFRMEKDLEYIKYMMDSPEWKKIREETKKVRLKETDEIKRLTEYAKENGSENAENYYMHYSNLIWKYLFVVDDGYENIDRNFLTSEQLNIVASAENIIRKSINEGLENEIEYHEIYQNTKDKIKLLASLIEITKIPYYSQISMI
jgi:phage regulator Rha-like protein